jgi:drug/metabolite transporter (DMT)-like permease
MPAAPLPWGACNGAKCSTERAKRPGQVFDGVGAAGFGPATSASQTRRSDQAELRPVEKIVAGGTLGRSRGYARAPVADAPIAPRRLDDTAAARRPAIGYALILAAVGLWSLNGVLAKVVVTGNGLSALRLAEIRATGAALLLFTAVALIRPASLRVSGREAGFLVLFGVFGLAFVHFFYFVAISHLDIGIALVIQYLAPVLIALWARFFVHEPVRRRLWVALALSLTGLSLVVELWGGGGTLNGKGVAASLGGAVAYALYILMADHRLQRGRDAFSLLAWGFVFAAVFWALAQPWWTFPTESLSGDTSLLGRLEGVEAPVWLLVAYIVVFGTIVPFLLMVSALHYVPPARATIVAMAEPVMAGLIAWAWLREELGPGQIVGGILVLAGIVLAQTARTGEKA